MLAAVPRAIMHRECSRSTITATLDGQFCRICSNGPLGVTILQLDTTDRAIVRFLSTDGRATYSEISKSIGVSVGTVRNRIAQMRESGAIHLNVWLDPYRVGLGVTATFLIKVHAGALDSVLDALVAIDATGYVAAVMGDHDAVADVFCRDVQHLDQVLRSEVEPIEGIMSVTSLIVTDIRHDSTFDLTGMLLGDGSES